MVKKLVYNAFCVLSVLFMLWIAFSWFDIVTDNTSAAPAHGSTNFFYLISEGATK